MFLLFIWTNALREFAYILQMKKLTARVKNLEIENLEKYSSARCTVEKKNSRVEIEFSSLEYRFIKLFLVEQKQKIKVTKL